MRYVLLVAGAAIWIREVVHHHRAGQLASPVALARIALVLAGTALLFKMMVAA